MSFFCSQASNLSKKCAFITFMVFFGSFRPKVKSPLYEVLTNIGSKLNHSLVIIRGHSVVSSKSSTESSQVTVVISIPVKMTGCYRSHHTTLCTTWFRISWHMNTSIYILSPIVRVYNWIRFRIIANHSFEIACNECTIISTCKKHKNYTSNHL
jgi:hypothetical protein